MQVSKEVTNFDVNFLFHPVYLIMFSHRLCCTVYFEKEFILSEAEGFPKFYCLVLTA